MRILVKVTCFWGVHCVTIFGEKIFKKLWVLFHDKLCILQMRILNLRIQINSNFLRFLDKSIPKPFLFQLCFTFSKASFNKIHFLKFFFMKNFFKLLFFLLSNGLLFFYFFIFLSFSDYSIKLFWNFVRYLYSAQWWYPFINLSRFSAS